MLKPASAFGCLKSEKIFPKPGGGRRGIGVDSYKKRAAAEGRRREKKEKRKGDL